MSNYSKCCFIVEPLLGTPSILIGNFFGKVWVFFNVGFFCLFFCGGFFLGGGAVLVVYHVD